MQQALDQLIAILEANLPANPKSPKNDTLARKLESDVKDYFTAVEQALPPQYLEQLYLKHVKVE